VSARARQVWISFTIGERTLSLSDHAYKRYVERTNSPQPLTRRQLADRLAEKGEIYLTPPAWTHDAGLLVASGRHPDEWVSLEERWLFAVTNGRLTTCLCRLSVSGKVRWRT
jgi:hypothetical protein